MYQRDQQGSSSGGGGGRILPQAVTQLAHGGQRGQREDTVSQPHSEAVDSHTVPGLTLL